MEALVYKSTGSWYTVETNDRVQYQARIRGRLKISDITSTNPIAVGDKVTIEPEDNGNMVITAIHDRRNYINRTSPHNKRQHHIVAANVDQSLLFATLKEPRTSLGFIDRFLVTSELYHIPAILVYNKADRYDDKDMQEFEYIKNLYEKIGYPVKLISVQDDKGVDDLITLLDDKITLISGHSGVGKSSFINKVLPQRDLRTQDVSEWSGKGMHTTTFAEMYDLPGGGRIIDTPGIRELGIVDVEKEELSHYFPEMRALLNDCRFNNCLHENEPGCAIKQAVNDGTISSDRYVSYLTIKDSLQEKMY